MEDGNAAIVLKNNRSVMINKQFENQLRIWIK